MNGSPGALIAVGLGVFLIAVAYLDKVKEVWTAALGSGPDFGATMLPETGSGDDCPSGQVSVTVEPGQPTPVRTLCIATASFQTCNPGMTRVRTAGGDVRCVPKVAGGQSYESVSLGSTGAWRHTASAGAGWWAEGGAST